MKIKSQSSKQSHKRDGIGAGRIETFPCIDSAYDCVIYDLVKTGLLESEIEAEGLTNHRVHFHAL